MRQYSALSAIPLTFFSKSLYQDVGQRWQGLGLGYLLLLATITWFPYGYVMNSLVQDFLTTRAPQLIQQIPTIHVVDGKIQTDQKHPYFIKDPKTQRLLVIIDTTGQYTSLQNTDAVMLVTSSDFLYRDERQQTVKQPLHDLQDGKDYLNPIKLTADLGIPFLKKHFLWLCFVVGALCYWLLYLVQTLICSIVGALFASSAPGHFPFTRIFRLCAVALTPVAIISVSLFSLHITFPYLGMLKVLSVLCYVYFAIKVNAQSV